jgi:hypothetical protein
MRRNADFARGSHVPSAVLDAMQDEAVGMIPATANPSGARALRGADGRYVCTPDAGVADGTLVVLDTSIDWRYRDLWGTLRRLEAAAQRQHGDDAWQVNDPSRAVGSRWFEGTTGAGGLGAGATTVANGTPPVPASGSFAVLVDEGASSADRVWLYARSSDGALCLYNDAGAVLHAELRVYGAGASPSLGATPGVPGRLVSPAGLATTDDAWTTAITITPTGSSMLTLDVTTSAVRSDGARGGSWRFGAGFRTPASSTPAQVGDTVFTLTVADDLSGGAPVWRVRATVSGADVLIQVRGATATNIRWRIEASVTEARA